MSGRALHEGLTSIDRAWLEKWGSKDLTALASVLAAPTTGLRGALIERILLYAGLRLRLRAENVESLQALKAAELKALLKSVGAYVPGNKYGMAAALINWREHSRTQGRFAIAAANHYRHVKRAVRRGDDVPDEVLSRYPDLQERPQDMPLFAGTTKETDR